MSSPAAPDRPHADKPPPTLSSRPFPPRVRRLLEGVLEYASDELERGLTATLNDVEQQLFKLAEQARSNEVQQACFEALRSVKRGRSDFTPRFMIGLESALADLHLRGREDAAGPVGGPGSPELQLLGEDEQEESTQLDAIASRAEVRSSLPLYLLGQRFGVMAGGPAFEPEQLPVGPQVLCRVMQQAAGCLDLPLEHRLLVFRQFERHVIASYGEFIEAINRFLAREGVLPTLSYVPMRVKRDSRQAGPAATPKPAEPGKSTRAGAQGAAPAPEPRTGWPGTPDGPGAQGQNQELFSLLRQLLASRREVAGKLAGGVPAAPRGDAYVASPSDLQSVLGVLQHKPAASVLVDGKPALRSVKHVKQDLLAQLRQVAPQGKTPVLSEEDTDTVDLVAMLFDFIMREIRPQSPAAPLLAKLQVPLMRVALRDKGFFTQQMHPARQMLSAIAETGAYWSDEDKGDRSTVEKMQSVVDRVVTDFDGDVDLFNNLSEDLGSHLQTLARKAEVAERRHVEAARGKEKLAMARMQAAEDVGARIKDRKVPRFVHTLLTQAWTDVLALSALRQGADSDAYRRQLAIAERLVEAACRASDKGLERDEAIGLRQEVEQSLAQVGYHGEDAKAIATRLTSVDDEVEEGEDDPASRTELALRLKARSRLGEDTPGGGGTKAAKAAKVPLTAAEQQQLERIRTLPFGAWFEFTTNQQGDRVRRRLSWYSTLTGHALFVNARGQRVADMDIDTLARSMAAGQARVMDDDRGGLIDRAWSAIVKALKSFGGTDAVPAREGGQA